MLVLGRSRVNYSHINYIIMFLMGLKNPMPTVLNDSMAISLFLASLPQFEAKKWNLCGQPPWFLMAAHWGREAYNSYIQVESTIVAP